jgi:cysteine desulfurase / selenocysteine lyase
LIQLNHPEAQVQPTLELPADPATEWRSHFPALSQSVGGRPLVYLDTAATSHRPRHVIDAIAGFYERDNANPSATLHLLARRANDRYDDARTGIARFIGASDPLEVAFTRGTTEAINLVASAWGSSNVGPGDEILIGIGEHASNMLPWQHLARRTGGVLRYFGLTDEGRVDLADFEAKLTRRTRVVAVSHVSNVLGIVNPVRTLADAAHGVGAKVLIDAAQSVPHLGVGVHELGCDFMAFSSHKMCGPMGVGVLWARRALLDAMPPYQLGSNMAHDVDAESANLSDAALKFGAGTPNVSGAVGLAAAAEFLSTLGRGATWAHEQAVTRHMLGRLREIDGLRLLGAAEASERVGVFSFMLDGKTPAVVATALDEQGIAVRAGDLASLPLLERFGERGAVRASCYLYTTLEEVDRFADTLHSIAASGR